ncbi:putative competence-damage inducible protein [Clostridia bacterium]|nr:putative competence-damage inducible protein [Clostridia bacterium]
MKTELISVGTELLLGNITNTNARFLAEECASLGLFVYYQSVVGDNMDRVCAVYRQALDRSDVVILTGGLGPTQDDLTKEAVAKELGKDLVLDEKVLHSIETYFQKAGLKKPVDLENKQAQVIQGAKVFLNENGTAPALLIEENHKITILLPGPPNEMEPFFTTQIKPYLEQKTNSVLFSCMVKMAGIGESQVEKMIPELIEGENPTVAPYAKTGEVHLRISAKATSKEEAKQLVEPVVKQLKEMFPEFVYSTDDSSLEETIVDELLQRNFTLTTAESCTGGLLAGRLTRAAGISKIYHQGFITYSNEAKKELLEVEESTLKEFGAVSEETVLEMAQGAAHQTGSDCSLAITGIAGPDGGSEEKPVGLVYIACGVRGMILTEKHHFSGNRDKIREQAVVKALTLLRYVLTMVPRELG